LFKIQTSSRGNTNQGENKSLSTVFPCNLFQSFEQELHTRHKLVALALGSQVPLRMEIERRILGQFHKHPGFQTAQPGLDTLLGRDEEITFEDFLSPPEEREEDIEMDSLATFERELCLF